MVTKTLLAKAIAIVTFLFAAFSGFLTNVAPPEETGSSFAVGFSSFVALAVFLILSAASKNQNPTKHKAIWLTAAVAAFAVALVTAFVYKNNLDNLTFRFPPENESNIYVRGTVLTPSADKYQSEHQGKTVADILGDYGGIPAKELVWTPESIRAAQLKLTINYVALVLSLAATIFSVTEGLLVEPKISQENVMSA
jgi:hypothetical protein